MFALLLFALLPASIGGLVIWCAVIALICLVVYVLFRAASVTIPGWVWIVVACVIMLLFLFSILRGGSSLTG